MVVGGKRPWMPRPLTLGHPQQCLDFRRKHKVEYVKAPLYRHFFLEEVQIIHSFSLHFLKPYILKICNDFPLYIYMI